MGETEGSFHPGDQEKRADGPHYISPRLTCMPWLHLRLCDEKNLIGVVSTHALDILLVAGPCLKLSSFADVFSAFEHVFSFLS